MPLGNALAPAGRGRMWYAVNLKMNGGFRALVVDDDEFSRATAVRILRRLGASDVAEAADGAQALSRASQPGPSADLILCDLRMPQVDGIETLGGLAGYSRSATFVLASSADPRLLRAAASSAQRAGAAALHVMSKPVTIGKLQPVVAAMLARHPGGAAPATTPETEYAFSADEIRRGLARGEFTTVYQPKVETRARRVCGAEALIRWNHPRFGILAPSTFMPVAQVNGLLADIFFVALPTAVGDCARWNGDGFPVAVSINLPTAVLSARDLPGRLEALAASHHLPPDRVTFEVTEDGWLHEQDLACEVLTRIRLRGFGLAIDDYGTGYSGLQQLLNAPFNELKIDGGFVRGAPKDPEAAIALNSIVALGRKLDLRVVAEGVETEAEWDFAAGAGCDEVQGYLISRPLCVEQFGAWLIEQAEGAATSGAVAMAALG